MKYYFEGSMKHKNTDTEESKERIKTVRGELKVLDTYYLVMFAAYCIPSRIYLNLVLNP